MESLLGVSRVQDTRTGGEEENILEIEVGKLLSVLALPSMDLSIEISNNLPVRLAL